MERKMDYSYQLQAANAIMNQILSGRYIASVLAAAPGSGKTTISHIILNKYVKMYPQSKILILAEGQNILKKQYLDELKDANVPICFNFGEIGSEAQVQVGLPQSVNNLKWDSIDLLIVDEAHNFFLAKMVKGIVSKLKPKHKILMTGTPTRYTLYNENNDYKYGIHYIAAEELMHNGVFSRATLDVAKITNKQDPKQVIKEVMDFAMIKKYDITKIMIACPDIEYANIVSGYLTYIGRKVSISTSDNDSDNEQIGVFKKGLTDTLIVVNKGILGFNEPTITCLLDLKSSSNLDSSYQLMARVLRKHPNNINKIYLRIAENKDYNKQVLTLHKICALMRKDIFRIFNGNNLQVSIN